MAISTIASSTAPSVTTLQATDPAKLSNAFERALVSRDAAVVETLISYNVQPTYVNLENLFRQVHLARVLVTVAVVRARCNSHAYW